MQAKRLNLFGDINKTDRQQSKGIACKHQLSKKSLSQGLFFIIL